MRPIAFVPVALFVAGGALIALAVVSGGATFGLLVIFPFVVGRSLDLAGGILLVAVGFFTLPLAVGDEADAEAADASLPRPTPSGGSGGILIVGPVPILFGRWKQISPRARLFLWIGVAAAFVLVVVGALLLAG